MKIHRFKHRQIPPAVRHGCFKDAVTTAWCKRKGHEKKKAWEDVEKKISTPPSLVPTAQKHNKWNVLWMLHGAHGSLCWSMTKSDDAFCESQDMVIPIWNWKVMFNSLLYKGRFTSALQTSQVSFSTIRLGTHGAHGTVVLRFETEPQGAPSVPGCTLMSSAPWDTHGAPLPWGGPWPPDTLHISPWTMNYFLHSIRRSI